MAEGIIDDHVNMDLVTSAASVSHISQSTSPAKTIAIRCRNMWENEKPRLLLKAQYLHNYLLLSKDFESLQTQARSEETPLGKPYAEDRSKKRRRRTSNDRTRATFVLDHMVSVMCPQGATNKQKKEAKDRLTRDRDMANNVACFVKVFGIGILPLMFNSAWRSA